MDKSKIIRHIFHFWWFFILGVFLLLSQCYQGEIIDFINGLFNALGIDSHMRKEIFLFSLPVAILVVGIIWGYNVGRSCAKEEFSSQQQITPIKSFKNFMDKKIKKGKIILKQKKNEECWDWVYSTKRAIETALGTDRAEYFEENWSPLDLPYDKESKKRNSQKLLENTKRCIESAERIARNATSAQLVSSFVISDLDEFK